MAAKRIENQGDGDFGAAAMHLEVVGSEGIRGGNRIVAVDREGNWAYVEPLSDRAGAFRLRKVHWLERWRDTGEITSAEFEAAEKFAADWRAAHVQPRYSSSATERVDRSQTDDADVMVAIERRVRVARDALKRDYAVLGLRAASILDRVLGLDYGLREFARWSARTGAPINDQVAKGMLLVALSVLAKSRGLG